MYNKKCVSNLYLFYLILYEAKKKNKDQNKKEKKRKQERKKRKNERTQRINLMQVLIQRW